METLTRLVNTRCSTRHNSPLQPHSLYFFTPATSHARASSFLHSSNFIHQSVFFSSLQQLLTPECLLFFTPATSYARASSFLHSINFLRQSVFFSSLQQLLFAVFALRRFLLFSLFLVVWMMLSPYSPSSFTLQSPDCSGIFLSDACTRHLYGNHFFQVSS